jgi:hypothetical protein
VNGWQPADSIQTGPPTRDREPGRTATVLEVSGRPARLERRISALRFFGTDESPRTLDRVAHERC